MFQKHPMSKKIVGATGRSPLLGWNKLCNH